MPVTRTFTMSIDTPDGMVGPARIEVCDEPARLSDLAQPIQALASGVVDLAIKRAHQNGQNLSCRAGCGICCCQLVPLAPAEAFYIVERLLVLSLDKRKPILQRFQSNENALIKSGLITRISALGETDDNNRVAQEYFALSLPCPFLVDDSCSIHEWRPIACREYNVTSSPALCANPFHNQITAIRLHRRVSAGLARCCADVAGLPLGLVPMPLVFDYYETHREAAERTWPGIELFENAIKLVCGKGK